jgi:hypothetical protein
VANQRQNCDHDRLRCVVDQAERGAEDPRLPGDRKILIAVDHIFALNKLAFARVTD